MPSPFPGMDPYLEQHWGDVHSSLVIYARNQLQKVLPRDLRARVEEHLLNAEPARFRDTPRHYALAAHPVFVDLALLEQTNTEPVVGERFGERAPPDTCTHDHDVVRLHG